MAINEHVITEAERLYKKFGNQATDVARELRSVDRPSEDSFWSRVIDYLNKGKLLNLNK